MLRIVLLSILVLAFMMSSSSSSSYYLLLPSSAHASTYVPTLSYNTNDEIPSIINDPTLKVEEVVRGLDLPTTMAFLGPNDILVLEKDKGTVQRIVNGKILPEPLLDVNVATSVERCMCGIAISKSNSNSSGSSISSNIGPTTTYVFLYFTEAQTTDSEDVAQGKAPLGNRLYRYELDNNNNKLINPVLLLDLPAIPGPRHNGGAIMIGPDNNLYIPIGDVDGSGMGDAFETKAQNYVNGVEPDGRSGILRITQDGKPVGVDVGGGATTITTTTTTSNGILGNSFPLNLYYAYGIRNSYGIDFDPITGKLWETENGPGYGDEINLVEPGFNSGWQELMGIDSRQEDFDAVKDLVDFGGKGKYSGPEFTWSSHTVGPTALKFLNSDNKLGKQYDNDMFVGDVHNGNIYHFKLNEARTDLVLGGGLLADKVADSDSELEESAAGVGGIIFGKGFGGITDLEVGPDGYLYVVSIGQGAIYRIVQTSDGPSTIAKAEDMETAGAAEDGDSSDDDEDGED
ncbi:MAG: PQQ-dependent sugar dehydrogenase [Nitrososphaeraceae archaeon]